MQVTIGNAKAYIYDTKGKDAKVVLSSSSKVAKLSTLSYSVPAGYKEVARVNASIFEMSTGKHLGWEYSDVYKTSQSKDGTADCIVYKNGKVLMGDFSKSEIDLDQVEFAYTGSHVIIQNGQDVCIVASWRNSYTVGNYCWSWFATRDDGSYVIGALDGNSVCGTDTLRSYLKGLGCTNAIVNDGGGSAELIIDGKVVNRTTERAIANGLFIYEKIETNDKINDKLNDKINDLESTITKALTEIKELKGLL